mmetsp:Transcript_6567/g.17058  ORF Transcript_6567/g.17058 Transcript_6567/m.17058 type:complete len:83 (-) Transcript_6567:527-775(-)
MDSSALRAAPAPSAEHQDCTQCKLIGGGVMLTVGAYFFLQTMALRRTPAEATNARFHTLVGTVFTSMGVYRLVTPLRKPVAG